MRKNQCQCQVVCKYSRLCAKFHFGKKCRLRVSDFWAKFTFQLEQQTKFVLMISKSFFGHNLFNFLAGFQFCYNLFIDYKIQRN